jgi:hypothetical protein
MKKEDQSYLQSKKDEDSGLSLLTKHWLSGDMVCHLLMISKRTLQSYRDRGILPFAQISRKIYYKDSDIDEYLNQHYIKSNYQKGGKYE